MFNQNVSLMASLLHILEKKQLKLTSNQLLLSQTAFMALLLTGCGGGGGGDGGSSGVPSRDGMAFNDSYTFTIIFDDSDNNSTLDFDSELLELPTLLANDNSATSVTANTYNFDNNVAELSVDSNGSFIFTVTDIPDKNLQQSFTINVSDGASIDTSRLTIELEVIDASFLATQLGFDKVNGLFENIDDPVAVKVFLDELDFEVLSSDAQAELLELLALQPHNALETYIQLVLGIYVNSNTELTMANINTKISDLYHETDSLAEESLLELLEAHIEYVIDGDIENLGDLMSDIIASDYDLEKYNNYMKSQGFDFSQSNMDIKTFLEKAFAEYSAIYNPLDEDEVHEVLKEEHLLEFSVLFEGFVNNYEHEKGVSDAYAVNTDKIEGQVVIVNEMIWRDHAGDLTTANIDEESQFFKIVDGNIVLKVDASDAEFYSTQYLTLTAGDGTTIDISITPSVRVNPANFEQTDINFYLDALLQSISWYPELDQAGIDLSIMTDNSTEQEAKEPEAQGKIFGIYQSLLDYTNTIPRLSTPNDEDAELRVTVFTKGGNLPTELQNHLGFAWYPDPLYPENAGDVIYRLEPNIHIEGHASLWLVQHEFLHSLGLAHVFDTDGASFAFPGSDGKNEDGTTVDLPKDPTNHELALSVFTNMSYLYYMFGNSNAADGHVSTAGALDTAALQFVYGVSKNPIVCVDNPEECDTTYPLDKTTWKTIWDTGGEDKIVAEDGETRSVTIDLRSATLNGEPGGGGFISRAGETFGGYTIAYDWDGGQLVGEAWRSGCNLIENATGGDGDDRLVANHAPHAVPILEDQAYICGKYISDYHALYSNTLDGGAGDDTAVFALEYDEYTVYADYGVLTVTRKIDGEPSGDVDTLNNIEKIQFADCTITSTDDLETCVSPGHTTTNPDNFVHVVYDYGSIFNGMNIARDGLNFTIKAYKDGGDSIEKSVSEVDIRADGHLLPIVTIDKGYDLYLACHNEVLDSAKIQVYQNLMNDTSEIDDDGHDALLYTYENDTCVDITYDVYNSLWPSSDWDME